VEEVYSMRQAYKEIASKWMELENIILSKVSQAQKVIIFMFSFICGL
jgi:hypothetical protein